MIESKLQNVLSHRVITKMMGHSLIWFSPRGWLGTGTVQVFLDNYLRHTVKFLGLLHAGPEVGLNDPCRSLPA